MSVLVRMKSNERKFHFQSASPGLESRRAHQQIRRSPPWGVCSVTNSQEKIKVSCSLSERLSSPSQLSCHQTWRRQSDESSDAWIPGRARAVISRTRVVSLASPDY